jgi:hypothetical protein
MISDCKKGELLNFLKEKAFKHGKYAYRTRDVLRVGYSAEMVTKTAAPLTRSITNESSGRLTRAFLLELLSVSACHGGIHWVDMDTTHLFRRDVLRYLFR